MSFLSFINLGYGAKTVAEKLSEEVLAELKRRFPTWEDAYYSNMMADDADCNWLLDHGFEVNLKRLKGLTGFSEKYVPERHSHAGSVHVHVPNIGLFSMTEVKLLEDACTDELQGMLDDGWRILAVCPPNSTRRPDYILGRSKEGK